MSLTLRDVRYAARVHEERLLSLPNVVRVCVGNKRVGNEFVGSLCIRVHVRRKRGASLLNEDAVIPKRLSVVRRNGTRFWVSTDVTKSESGLRLLAIEGAQSVKGHTRVVGSTGLVYRSNSGRDLLLTNAHVATGPGFGVPRLNASVRLSRPSGREIAVVHRASPLVIGGRNRMDAALGWVYQDELIVRRGIAGESQSIVGTRPIRPGSIDRFFYVDRHGSGRKTFEDPVGARRETITFDDGHQAWFENFIVLRQVTGGGAPLVPGDSGSLLVRQGASGLLACGLVFAGVGRTLAVYPIDAVLASLGGPRSARRNQLEDVRINFNF